MGVGGIGRRLCLHIHIILCVYIYIRPRPLHCFHFSKKQCKNNQHQHESVYIHVKFIQIHNNPYKTIQRPQLGKVANQFVSFLSFVGVIFCVRGCILGTLGPTRGPPKGPSRKSDKTDWFGVAFWTPKGRPFGAFFICFLSLFIVVFKLFLRTAPR